MDFNQIINKSSVLMSMEKNGEIDKIRSRKKQSNDNTEKIKTDINESFQQTDYSSVKSKLNNISQNTININPNTKLPKEIVDSFRNSLLEEEKKNNEMMKLYQNKIQVHEEQKHINEENIVDDRNIKNLIKETIKEELSSLKLLSINDKINIITTNGDVFEVNLVYKKNINNKKK